MGLNYNKWDKLELSDDSDIEEHPNVDKKSMIRWKQRDIHEKRMIRDYKIDALLREHESNKSLLARMDEYKAGIAGEGAPFVARNIEQLRAKLPNYDKGLKENEEPSLDHMSLSLLIQVANKAKDAVGGSTDPAAHKAALEKEMAWHIERLTKRQGETLAERQALIEEKTQKITSDDVHFGWDSKTKISSGETKQPVFENKVPEAQKSVPQAPASVPQSAAPTSVPQVASSAPQAASSAPQAASSAPQAASSAPQPAAPAPSASTAAAPTAAVPTASTVGAPSASTVGAPADEVPTLTPEMASFAKIPILDFEKSYRAVSQCPALLKEETTDALLMQAFDTAMAGRKEQTYHYVHQGLLIQYCGKLGRDGVSLFFQRIMSKTDPRARKIFLEDVASTTARIMERAQVVAAEREEAAEDAEQIQLVAQDPSVKISFEVPDGPPPAEIRIEGEGAETIDVNEFREYLQRRWDIFAGFPKDFQDALAAQDLDAVNRVLGALPVARAEALVGELQESGILSFAQEGVVDATGK